MAPAALIDLGPSQSLQDGGDGLRFEVESGGHKTTAFAVRYRGSVHAYLNRCAHVAVELDWQLGRFFDSDAQFLVCSMHGALYDPQSGRCLGGACRGRGGLRPLDVFEDNGHIWWRPDEFVRPLIP